jgi:lipoate-protein ligase A
VPWRHDERTAGASVLHAGWPEVDAAPGERAVARCRPTGAAVVLGSTQAETDVDVARATAAGLTVARRRSGGGLVLVEPGDPLWLDVWVPASDPLWEPDVLASFDWLGRAWARALGSVGLDVDVHRGRLEDPGGWGRRLCFGAVGAGEVVTAADARRVRKVVGISQRRTRTGSWFHGACPLGADQGRLTGVLAGSEATRRQAERWLRDMAPGLSTLLGTDEDAASLADRLAASFAAALP